MVLTKTPYGVIINTKAKFITTIRLCIKPKEENIGNESVSRSKLIDRQTNISRSVP